jgi:dTDP-4-amino-4,6-dideoxygalactose transaminase
VDVARGIAAQRSDLLAAAARVLDSGQFAGGPEVAAFERDFARACGVAHAVAVRTGTDALLLALRALGIRSGDEVICPTHTFFATAEAIAHTGARPVFCDVRDHDLTLDPDAVRSRLSERVRAIIPVHIYGLVADMAALRTLADTRSIPLLEDACQAHGAIGGGGAAGALGTAAAFSFYASKNLGAIGEGGCVTTSNTEIAERVRILRDHGQRQKHHHVEIGYNARLGALECALLAVRLRQLDARVAARRQLAAIYREALSHSDRVRIVGSDRGHAYHLFVVRVGERDRVRAHLTEVGIETAIHYPTPVHLQPAFAALGHKPGDFPVAERAADEILSLPMFPELSHDEARFVADALLEAVR